MNWRTWAGLGSVNLNQQQALILGHTWVWVHRCALKQDGGGTIAQWAVNHIAVSCYPADVCHAAKHVTILVVEDILKKRHKQDTQQGSVCGGVSESWSLDT